MRECKILGMDLNLEEDDILMTAQPISGFVVVKAFDEDGDVVYLTAATHDLPSVECLGMVEYAGLALRLNMTRRRDDS